MSGFVIAHAYEHRLKAGLGFGAFLRIRLVRLYPLYALGAVVAGLSAAAGFNETFHWGAILWTFTLTPTPPPLAPSGDLFPYNNVGWSLFLEIVVNAVYALTWRFWTPERLRLVVLVAGAGLIAATVAYGNANMGYAWRNLTGGALRIAYAYPLGVLIYRHYRRGDLPAHAPLALLLGAPLPFLRWGPAGGAGVAWELFGMMIVMPLVAALAVRARTPDRLITISSLLGAAS